MNSRIAVIVAALAFSGCMSGPPTAPIISKGTPLTARSKNAEAGRIRAVSATYEPGSLTINVVTQDADQFQRSFWMSGTIYDAGIHVGGQLPDFAWWAFRARPAFARELFPNFIPAEGDSFPFYYLTVDTLPSGFAHWSVQGNRITLRFPIVLSSPASFFGLGTWSWHPNGPLSRLISFTAPTPIAFTRVPL